MNMTPVVGQEVADRHRRHWIAEGMQPQCVRDGVPHDPERLNGESTSRHEPRHAVLAGVLKAISAPADRNLAYTDRDVLAARDLKTIGKGAKPEAKRAVAELDGSEAGNPAAHASDDRLSGRDFGHMRDKRVEWNRLAASVILKPFFGATPYPGTEWLPEYKKPDPRAVRRGTGSVPARSGRLPRAHRGHLQEVQRRRDLRAWRAHGPARLKRMRRVRAEWTGCTRSTAWPRRKRPGRGGRALRGGEVGALLPWTARPVLTP